MIGNSVGRLNARCRVGIATVNLAAALLAGCDSPDRRDVVTAPDVPRVDAPPPNDVARPDVPAPPDVPRDDGTPPDVPRLDGGMDAMVDAAGEVAVDAAGEAAVDAAREAALDAAGDTPATPDASADAAGSDATPADGGTADAPAGDAAVTDVDWTSTATAYRGMDGLRLSFRCPTMGLAEPVWGTDLYTDDSSVCTAAVHVGRITLAAGGVVTIEIRPGAMMYTGSTRNGITTSDYAAWLGSYVFP